MSDDVCAQTPAYRYCSVHGGFYRGFCPNCRDRVHAGYGIAPPPADEQPGAVDRMRLTVALQTIAVLEEQIAALRLRVAELEQGNADRQRAHNALARAVEQLAGGAAGP